MADRPTSRSLWKNRTFLVYFTMLSLLTLFMLGSFLWQVAQNRMVRGMIDEQRTRLQEQAREMKALERLSETDEALILDGQYHTVLSTYKTLLDSAPSSIRPALEHRIERLHGLLEQRANEQGSMDMKDMLIDRYRRTIEDLEAQSTSLRSRITRISDSLEGRFEDMLAEISRKEKELNKKDKVQVISFTSPKGHKIHYLGEVENGKANGGGVGIWATGSIYKGDWRNNLRHGRGTFEWADGERYEGEYVDGIREGRGTYHWPSGDRDEGEWKGDRRNGQGPLFDMDGNVRYKGLWKDDKPVE